MRHRGRTLLRALLAVFAALIAFDVTPALAAEPPATSKTVKSNGDGTYTLSLSVTGKSQASSSSSKADVIVVLDTSGSMSERADDSRQSRLSVAKSAVNSLAEQLLSNNTTENPDSVRLSLVTFADYATTRVTGTTSLSSFQRQVNRLTATGGTNWEDALATANAIQTRDGVEAYVIFVSDGNPTFRNTRGTKIWWQNRDEFEAHSSDGHRYYGTGNSDAYGLNYDYAEVQAVAIAGEGKSFFAIGAFGTVSNMQDLAAATGQTGNYYNAADSAALNAAFDNIINTITNNLTYSNVKVTDGITALTATSLGGGSADAFAYTKTKNGVTSDWLDAPEATYDETNKNVTWDLSSLGSLEHGVTYTVSFKVWPSQEAITEVARLQNAGTTTGLPTYIVYDSTAGTYGIKTNTAANVSYNQTSTTTTNVLPTDAVPQADGTWTSPSTGLTYTQESSGLYVATKSDTGSVALADPDPMTVDTPTITVSKEWVDSLDNAVNRPTGDVSLGVLLDRKQFTTVTLNSDNNYRAQVHVPYGIEVNGEVLTAGREVTFSEPAIDSRYELSYEPFTPMMVDGVPNYADDGSTTVTATNTLKSQLEIAKVVTSDGGVYPTDASFDFDVTVTTPDSSDVSYAIGDTTGTLTSGQTTTLSLAAGQSILLENLPVGTTYKVDEKSSPAGWTFSSVATGGAGTISGDAVSGSVDQGNTKYSVTYTNKFTPVESSPTGDGDITINKTLSPTELTAEQFSFTLTALGDAPAPASTTATNAADGSVSFGNITFSKVGTYEYTLAETNAGADGYTYDSATYTLVATVTANADTNALEVAWSVKDSTSKAITFSNTYAATGTATISATKTLSGRDMNANEFAFNITNAKGNVVATAQNPAAGDGQAATLDFGTLNYSIDQVKQDVESGVAQIGSAANTYVYRYTVSEDTAHLPTKVTPVQNAFEVTVVVTDSGDGTLRTQVKYPGDATSLAFQNVYDADDARLVISGSKMLETNGFSGPGDIKDKFTFELKDASGKVIDTATNDASGSVTFDEITYTAPGEYTYTITESGTVDGVTNDTATKTVKVKVTDEGGYLVAETVDENDNPVEGANFTFTNSYSATSTTAAIEVAKNLSVPSGLTGPGDIAGKYTFTLAAETADAPMPESTTVTSVDGNGTPASFDDITFTKPGIYNYRITESGSVDGVTNDAEAATGKLVMVTVVDNGNGTMTATTSGTTIFTNTYGATPATLGGDAAHRVTKKVEGHDASTGFTFVLAQSSTDANQASIAAGGSSVTTGALADGAEQTLKFGDVTFSAPGTYNFTITEQGESGQGWTYDTTPRNVAVTVVDNGNGQLEVSSVTGNDPVVTNSYHADSVTLTVDTAIQVTKTVTGHDSSEAFEFTLTPDFDLTDSGVTVANNKATTSGTIADGGSQTVSFGDITFTKAGTYRFHANETQGTASGWTYSTAQPDIVVVVTDNGEGQLVAAYGDNSNNPTFENTYAASGTATVSATKTLTGRAMNANEFTFNIRDANDNVVATAKNPAANDGEAAPLNFRALEYNSDQLAADVENGLATANNDGTYTYRYTAAEDTAALPGGVKAGAKSFTFTVTVSDNGDGTLAAIVNYPDGATELAFTNSYEASTTTATTLSATKILTGRDMTEGEFSFTVANIKGKLVATATNAAATDGTAASLAFTYGDGSASGLTYTLDQVESDIKAGIAEDGPADPDKPGRTAIYRYNVYENTANLPAGVSAVKDTFSINVLVVDNGDGTLSATVNYPGDGLAFENSYDATDAELYINGAKRLMVGDELAGPGYITGKYQFTITGGDGAPMPGETTVANQAGGTVEFGPISYDKAGTYTYTITESGHVNGVTNDADATKTVTVKVTDEGGHLVAQKVDSDGVAVQGPDFIFTNTYGVEDKTLSGDDALRATKVLEGRDLKADEFTFSLKSGEADAPMPASATTTNDADGNVVFGDINFKQANVGKTYHYYISEVAGDEAGVTYDTAVHEVTVEVVDNGDGTMSFNVTGNNPTFTNTYTTNEVTVDLTASKVLSGATLQDGQFEFEANVDGISVDKHNDANGNVSFGSVTYTVDVLAGQPVQSDGSRAKPFSYTVKELVPSDAVNGVKDGVTYDQSEWTITVTVKDDGQGNLTATKSATKTNSDDTTVTKDEPVFNNTYTAKPVTLTGDTALTVTKRVTGFNSSEAYSFNLALASGDSAGVSYADSAMTSASIADGATETVSFGDVTFSKAGTYTFNVTEVQGSKDGWTYDKSTHTIAVNVVDNGKGQLVATVTGNNPTFENSYEAAESDGVTITATKVLTGSPLMAGEFSFQLIDADGKVVRETTNAADGSITFDPITYTKPGTYTYNLKEVAGTNAGMAYDSTVHTVTVVATDDGTGQIHASVTSLAPTFNNSYKSGVDDPVMLTAEKVLEGRRLEAGQFSFHLFDENNQPVGEQVTNDVSGSIQFPALRYSQDDFNGIEPDETTGARTKTVTYTAREVAGSAAGYTYSQNVATYTLELVDSHDGKITATLKEAVNTTFTNNYEAQPVTAKSFSATKALEGRGLAEGEFEFQLTAAEGTPMPQATTATNAADGTVAFSPITYHLGDLAGETSKTFTYTISEVANGKAGVTYDQTKHTASVTVTDNGDGTLSVSDPVYDDGSATAPTFTNTYKAAAVTTALPTVTKIVSGDKPDAYPTFTFALEALNGSILPDSAGENGVTTGIINGDGAVSLGSVTFDQAGTYSYKAYEVAGNAEGWTYDNTVYNVTYTVTDDGAGVLGTSTSISTSDGTAADAVTFENVYTAPAPEPEPEPEPTPAPEPEPEPAKDPEPAKEEPKKPAIPNTGDATQTALPVGLAVAAAAVLAAAVMVRRRGRRSK